MNENVLKRETVVQTRKDAGCPEDIVARFLQVMERGSTAEQLRLLSCQTFKLLERVYMEQKNESGTRGGYNEPLFDYVAFYGAAAYPVRLWGGHPHTHVIHIGLCRSAARPAGRERGHRLPRKVSPQTAQQ